MLERLRQCRMQKAPGAAEISDSIHLEANHGDSGNRHDDGRRSSGPI